MATLLLADAGGGGGGWIQDTLWTLIDAGILVGGVYVAYQMYLCSGAKEGMLACTSKNTVESFAKTWTSGFKTFFSYATAPGLLWQYGFKDSWRHKVRNFFHPFTKGLPF